MTAFQILQGLETLPLRMARHIDNASKVVAYLATRKEVERINHPELAAHPGHELAKRLYPRGCSAILSFELKGGREAGRKFIDCAVAFLAPGQHRRREVPRDPSGDDHAFPDG